MNELMSITLNDFIQLELPVQYYKTDIIFSEIHAGLKYVKQLEDMPMRLDALNFIFVSRGDMQITIDYKTYNAGKYAVVSTLNKHVIHDIRVSPDFQGIQIVVSREFLSELVEKRYTIPLDVIISSHAAPVIQLGKEDFDLLHTALFRISRQIKRSDHHYQEEMIRNELRSFLFEIANIACEITDGNPATITLDHKEEIVKHFFLLLSDHGSREHEVTFYARKLCITPEYLTRIVKQVTDKVATEWIAIAIMIEAKILLRDPELTIQQVADRLHFSDQSSFGKFFKKHRGLSPLRYRKDILVNNER